MIQTTVKTPKSTRSSLLMLLISLLSLVALGCGDNQDDYVFTNTNNPGGVGNVVFQFVQAQAGTVPLGTTTLAFDFYNTANPADGTVIFTATSAFANVVTVVDVPVEARSVVITAYDVDGHPTASLTDEIVVLPGVNNPTDLGNAIITIITFNSITVTPATVNLNLGEQDPSEQLVVTANFSNGESIVQSTADNAANGTFNSSNDAAATVDANGLVEAVGVGTATITIDYELDGQVQSDTVDVSVTSGVVADVLTVTPETLTVAQNSTSGALSATISINGGNPIGVDVPSSDISFAEQTDVAGISVDPANGAVTVANGTADGTDFVVVATYNDGNGNTATDTVAGEVGVPALLDVAFSEPVGPTLELPFDAFQYQLQIVEYFADNTSQAGNPADYDFSSSAAGTAGVSAGGVLTTGTAGSATINLLEQGTQNVLDSVALTVSDTTVDSTIIVPDTFSLAPNSSDNYRITANYANGNSEDITSATQNSVYAIYSSGDAVLTLNDGFQLGTISSTATTGTGTYNVVINGGNATPMTFTPDSFTVTVGN